MKRLVVARTIGGFLILGGGAVVTGWVLRIPFWEGLSPTGTLMVAPTALCFVLCGVGLLGAGSSSATMRAVRLASVCSTAAIAALMLAETALTIDLGIDFPELHRWYIDNNPHPGRMAPNTAITFLLAAGALQLRATSTTEGVFFYALPAAVVTMGVIGLTGYTALFDLAYGWYDVPRMAATTAIGMVLLGGGLIACHSLGAPLATPAGLPRYVGERRGYAFLGVSVTILAMIVFVSYGSIRALVSRNAWVEHTAEVRVAFETLSAIDAKAHSTWRIHQATGDSRSLEEMYAAGDQILNRLTRLQTLTADNPVQLQRLAEIRQLVESNIALLKQENAARAQGETDSSAAAKARRAVLLSNRQRFDALTAMFREEENRLLARRRQESGESIRTTIWVILAGNAIGFAIMCYAGWQLKRQNDLRDRLISALKENQDFLDSLIEHIPSVISVKDARDLRLLRINKAAEKMFGVSRSELVGKTSYDLFGREEADVYNGTDRTALAGDDALEISEQSIQTKTGDIRIVDTTKVAIRSEDGSPKYLLGIGEDVTERRLTEREIVALNQRLTARAGELEAINRELESFTYSVSHDLRAPLRAINGYALMLEEDYRDKLDESGRRYIEQIRAYSRQMGDLIDDLLRLSRFGRQALKIVDIDMNRLVSEVVTEQMNDERWNRAEIRIDNLPNTRGDMQLLGLVWGNLISNALKYSSKVEHPLVRIGGHIIGDEAIYSVTDNGVGFDMTYYEKLFSVFHRLHRNDEFPGTGIGLAIVHRVVVRHGGRTWAEGAINKGATFFFALPTAESPLVAKDETEIRAS